MSILFYAIVICFVVNVGLYFHSGISVILTLLIVILLIILCRLVKVPLILSVKSSSDISRSNYKKLRVDMSNSERNLNTPERNKSTLGIGLFSNYDSRLGRSRCLKSSTSVTENFSIRSPNRTNSKVTKLQSDENYVSKSVVSSAENEMSSPVRSGLSPFRSTPLSYSKRFNTNPQSSLLNASHSFNQSRFSLLDNSLPSRSLRSPNSSIRSFNCEEKSPSTFSGRMITVANQMDSDQFPWIAYNGSIPMILSNSPNASSPVTKVSSPSADANSSFRNRVRVRLSKPNKSDTSVSNSNIENSSVLDESSTTKSVIQVLKEIARKRCLATEEEEEEQEGQPQVKRRTEHNLYLSRLEGEEEEQVPLTKLRLNGEDERMKRTREPDWDTSSVSNPKRPRKSYNFVNNEIISSLSSSIGLQAFKHSQRRKLTRKSIAIQVQTLVPEDNARDQKEQAEKSSQLSKSPPKTRDAGVETDPLPEPRPRSPVKEKVVSDVKGILKSALKKFDIQPSTSVTDGSDSMVTSPINSIPPALSDKPSTVSLPVSSSANLLTPFLSTNQSATATPINSETTTKSSFNLMSPKKTESVPPASKAFTTPSSAPLIGFGMSSTSPAKNSQTVKTNENKQELLPKSTGDKLAFKLGNKDVSGAEPSFKFGVASSDSNIESSVSQPPVTSSNLFNFKAAETSVPNEASLPVSSSSVFTFGTPKTPDTSKDKVTEEKKSVFGSAFSTTATSSINPVTPLVQPQNPSLSTGTVSNSSEQKAESKSSAFTFQNKPSEVVKSSTEDKKEVVASGVFNFGKPENKINSSTTKPEGKTFQFGSDGFTFGQASTKGSSGGPSNNTAPQPTSTTSLTTASNTTMQPVFSFSSSSTKKDSNAGGFTFNAPVTTSNDQKSLFNFNTSSSFGSTSSSTKSTFPASLFGNNSENPNTTTATTAKVSNAPTSNTSAASTTFGNAMSKSAPAFGLSPATSTAPTFGTTVTSTAPTFGTTVTSTAPTFGSAAPSTAATFGSTTATTPTFGSTAATAPTFGSTAASTAPTFGSTATSGAPTFGSTATSAAPTFGSTEAPKSLFGSVPNQPSFGNPSPNASIFGSNITTNETNKPSVFGSSSTITSPPAFGASSASSTGPTFGSVAANNNSNNNPAFGSSAAGVSNNPTFGTSATNTNIPTFGSGASSAFGSTTVGNTFSSGTTVSATNPSPFGASSAGPSASGFSGTNNAPPSFGGTPAFGSSASVPAFGSSSTSTFGNSAPATPAFGNQAQPSFGSQAGTSFGTSSTFGQASSTPSFGSQNTFSTQNTTTPAFGSTPAFGGSSTNTFGSTSVPGTTSAFGTASTPASAPAPAFGSSTTFGNQETSKPFTFNAPASQPAQAGTFNFTAPQPQQSSGGLFQFGAGSSSAPSSQPFQFNASQSSTPVGGTGQQMFSIGSGSTAPRRMTGRRKK